MLPATPCPDELVHHLGRQVALEQAFDLISLPQAADHLVERLRHPAHLVRAAHGDFHGQISQPHPARRRLELHER
jgi:hypothetical protein